MRKRILTAVQLKTDRLDEIKGTSFDMLVFTTETKAQAERILNAYKHRLPPEGEFTRGLFTRGVE